MAATILRVSAAALFAAAAASAAKPSALSAAPAALRARLESYGHPLSRPAAPAARAPPAGFGVRVSPLDFGADPTGAADSAPAFAACVAFCTNYSNTLDAFGTMVGDASFGNGKHISNAGGCTIDLGGGEYLLSSPVKIPQFIANMNVRGR